MSGETPLRARDYQCRQDKLADWPVRITSYKLGDRYYRTVDNVNPGACLARAQSATREGAERQALATAEALLSRTRLFPVG